MRSVDFGRWKLVMSASMPRKTWPGPQEDISLAEEGLICPRDPPRFESRQTVVPTAMIRPPFARASLNAARGLGADLAPFGMHAVVSDILCLHGRRSRADMQGEEGVADALRCEPLDEHRREMQ